MPSKRKGSIPGPGVMKVNIEESPESGVSPEGARASLDGHLLEGGLALVDLNIEGLMQKAPKEIVNLTGFTEEELVQIPFCDLVFPEDRPKIEDALSRTREGTPAFVPKVSIYTGKSGFHPVSLLLLPKGPEGRPAGHWVILKGWVGGPMNGKDRSVSIGPEEVPTKVMTDFVALLAKEMRQPLTTIMLNLEMLDSGLYGEMTERQREKIAQSLSLVEGMKGIIGDAIITSKDMEERTVPGQKFVPFSDIVHDVVERMVNAMSAKGVRPSIHFPRGMSGISVDYSSIFQALTILIGRSVDQCPSNGELQVDMEEKGTEVQLSVSDPGPGISDGEVGSLFSRLEMDGDREGMTLRDRMGMFLAGRIIRSNGGRVWCESFEGLGTTFFIVFPLAGGAEGIR